MELDSRARAILQAVVEAYIDDAQPVGSTTVLRRRPDLNFSPATVRHVMAELEEAQMLLQPHSSAGRVPTDKGLRCYLDGLMSPKLHPWDRSRLDAAAALNDPAEFPTHLGESLAGLSHQVAVVAVPRFLGSYFREVGLVACGGCQVLAYFISLGGLVQQKRVEVDFEPTLAQLNEIQNLLNERLRGRTLEEVRQLVVTELARAEVTWNELARRAFSLAQRVLPDSALDLVIVGASHLVDQPEFADREKLRQAFKAIEDKTALLKLLTQLIDSKEVKVILGSEQVLPEVADLACVGGAFAYAGGRYAAISLLGPARMDYGRLVPLVGYATELFGKFWERI
jgi:heat-inducible transcriptional repressor